MSKISSFPTPGLLDVFLLEFRLKKLEGSVSSLIDILREKVEALILYVP